MTDFLSETSPRYLSERLIFFCILLFRSPEGIACIVDTQFGEDFVTNRTSNVYAQEIASLQAQLGG